MTGLGLVVETPRGGNAGHRFLTSRNNIGESEIARAAAASSQSAVGRAYISISRQVTQQLPNGAVREGCERLILLGLDVDELRPDQIEQVKVELAKLLPSLDSLIQSIQWPYDGQSTVIAREELWHWVDSEAFRHLPVSRFMDSNSAAKSVSPYRALWKWLPIGGICILASVVLLWVILGRQGGNAESGSTQKPHLPSTNNESRVRNLAGEWICTPEDLLRSLLRASNWDRRREAEGLTLAVGLTDGEVLEILNKVAKSDGSEKYCVSPSIEGALDFRQFVEDRPSLSAEDIKCLRMWLYFTWLQFIDLKQAAQKAQEPLIEAGTADAFSRMLVSVPEVQTEVGVEALFQNPTTPLFERQDLMIFRVLEDVRQRCVAAGFDQFGTKGEGDLIAANDLAIFVNDMRFHRKDMLKAIETSRALVTDKVSENQGPEVAATVRAAYNSFKKFLEQLSKNPIR
jgi:hypothetical protein